MVLGAMLSQSIFWNNVNVEKQQLVKCVSVHCFESVFNDLFVVQTLKIEHKVHTFSVVFGFPTVKSATKLTCNAYHNLL